jgi:hypothetical protein
LIIKACNANEPNTQFGAARDITDKAGCLNTATTDNQISKISPSSSPEAQYLHDEEALHLEPKTPEDTVQNNKASARINFEDECCSPSCDKSNK